MSWLTATASEIVGSAMKDLNSVPRWVVRRHTVGQIRAPKKASRGDAWRLLESYQRLRVNLSDLTMLY